MGVGEGLVIGIVCFGVGDGRVKVVYGGVWVYCVLDVGVC